MDGLFETLVGSLQLDDLLKFQLDETFGSHKSPEALQLIALCHIVTSLGQLTAVLTDIKIRLDSIEHNMTTT